MPNAFSDEDRARILARAADGPRRAGGLVGGVRDPATRSAELVWLDDCPWAGWVSDRLAAVVARANREHHGIEIEEFAEDAQIARYGADLRGQFAWYSDIGAGRVAARRKLMLVVQLSGPGDYDGGVLELWPDGAPQEAVRARGAAILLPPSPCIA